jgi:hypothetical protein
MDEIKNYKIISNLPEEFSHRIENDLNKIVEAMPEYLSSILSELRENFHFPNAFEFLTGLCVGHCMGSYVQAYQQVYEKIPSSKELTEIHEIIFRRRIQIEQSVSAFLEESNAK